MSTSGLAMTRQFSSS